MSAKILLTSALLIAAVNTAVAAPLTDAEANAAENGVRHVEQGR